jgi:hypothetical protein
MMMTIQTETLTIHKVPLTMWAPSNRQGCPLVFHIHGLTGNKSHGADFGRRPVYKRLKT